MNVSLALLVDKNRTEFKNFESTQELDTFTVAYFERAKIAQEFLTYFPNAGAYPFSKLDAYLTSVKRASALTIFNPEYMVTNPLLYVLVFPLAKDDVWTRYIDKWIDYRKHDGYFDIFYKQWILGKANKPKEKNWNFYDSYFFSPSR